MSNDNNDVPTIDVDAQLREAYRMGLECFEGETPSEEERPDLAPFYDTSDWANNVLPRLRAMAGYADQGHGTYTQSREVQTAEGEITESHWILDELVEAWRKGAYDSREGEEPQFDV